ncbi:arginase family protein [Streptomyces sp. NPDC003327]
MPPVECLAAPVPLHSRPTTFMGLPFDPRPAARDLVVLGMPYDESGRRPGPHPAPRAVRDVSALAHVPGADRGPGTFDLVDCVDGGDVDVTPWESGSVSEVLYRRLSRLLAANAAVLLLGGGRALTAAALCATAERHGPLALLHLGAGPEDAVRRAVEDGLVDPSAVVRVGLGASAAPERGPGRGPGLVLDADRWGALGVRGAADVVRHRVGRRPVYVSVSADLAATAPAPGGGPTAREVLGLLRCVGDLSPVGFEVTGAAAGDRPTAARSGATAALAAEIGGELIHQYARAQCIPM